MHVHCLDLIHLVITFKMPIMIIKPSWNFNFHSLEIHFCEIVVHIYFAVKDVFQEDLKAMLIV